MSGTVADNSARIVRAIRRGRAIVAAHRGGSRMGRLVQMAYASCLCRVPGGFLYAIGFVGDLVVPKTIDSGPPRRWSGWRSTPPAGLFAVQHSVMAPPAFKRWWTRIVRQARNAAPMCCFPASSWFCCSGSGVRCDAGLVAERPGGPGRHGPVRSRLARRARVDLHAEPLSAVRAEPGYATPNKPSNRSPSTHPCSTALVRHPSCSASSSPSGRRPR